MEDDFQTEAMPHLDALYRYALRLTRNDKDAEDLLQDTFLRAFRFWGNYQKGTNCKAWLYRIMKNLFLNKVDKKKEEAKSRLYLARRHRGVVPLQSTQGIGPRRRPRGPGRHLRTQGLDRTDSGGDRALAGRVPRTAGAL